jgi:hypothetical protein
VYLVETRNEGEAEILAKMFQDFSAVLQSIQLSKGKLVAYAVQLHTEDQSLLEEIEQFLKTNFGFVILHRSFDDLIYDIVRDLSKDSGSSVIPIPKCNICGKPEPFPETLISFLDKDNSTLETHYYCATCTAESSGKNNKEFVLSLLRADRAKLNQLQQAELIRSRSKKYIAYRVKSDAEQCAAT